MEESESLLLQDRRGLAEAQVELGPLYGGEYRRKAGVAVLFFTLSILSTLLFMLGVYFAVNSRERNGDIETLSLPPLSIHIEKDSFGDRLYVVDNYPLLGPSTAEPLVFKDNDVKDVIEKAYGSNKKEILAEGRWIPNVRDNGWHYLSVTSTDLDLNKQKASSSKSNSEDREYFSKRYLRTLEAMGYLGKSASLTILLNPIMRASHCRGLRHLQGDGPVVRQFLLRFVRGILWLYSVLYTPIVCQVCSMGAIPQ